jgi:alanine racemase
VLNSSTTLRSRAWVDVDLQALKRNLLRVREAAGAGTSVVPMVKADAYGLGAARIWPALVEALAPGGPWALGVAALAEGEELRRDGWTGRVVVFSPLPPGELARAAAAGLTPCFSDLDALRGWAELAADRGERLPFQLEVDTGMGRAGLPWSEAVMWGAEVVRIAGDLLTWEGCYTHFHSADEPDLASTAEQWRRFREALVQIPPEGDGAPRRVLHCANSAAALRCGFDADLVRPGIFLYGGRAGPGTAPEAVVAVRARIALVREVPAGTTLGYGATYTARGAERWGTLSIGYGDGLPRRLSPAGGEALVHGRRVPIIGRISMDVTVVDLTGVPGAAAGDVATLIGGDGGDEITVDEVAARCGAISYEILTGLGARLPRVYSTGPTRGAAD